MMSTDTRFQCTYLQRIISNMLLLFYLEGKQVSLSVIIMADIHPHKHAIMTLLPGTLGAVFHATVTRPVCFSKIALERLGV